MKCACNSQLKSQALSSWHIHTAACYTTALALLHLCCTTASALQMQMLQHSISTAKFMQLMYHVKFIVASQFVLQYLCCSFHSAALIQQYLSHCSHSAALVQPLSYSIIYGATFMHTTFTQPHSHHSCAAALISSICTTACMQQHICSTCTAPLTLSHFSCSIHTAAITLHIFDVAFMLARAHTSIYAAALALLLFRWTRTALSTLANPEQDTC